MVLMAVVWHTYLKFLFFDLEPVGTGLQLMFEDLTFTFEDLAVTP